MSPRGRRSPSLAGWRALPIVAGLAGVAGLGACGGIPAQRADRADALRAVPRDPIGRPVMSLQWKKVTADRSEELRPQEFASPLFFEDTVYVGSQGGHLWALRARDGGVRWKARVGAVSAAPAIAPAPGGHGGWLYVGNDDGELLCVDAQTGTVQWKHTSRGPIEEPPVVVGGLVLFANEADQVSAVDARTGAFRWQYRSETPDEYTLRGHAGIAVDGELAFTGFANGSLVALRVANGSVAWLASLKSGADRFVDVDATPAVVGSTVYATSSSGGVYGLDKATGLVRWQMPLVDGPAASHPNPGNAGGLTSDGQGVYVIAADQGIYALDLDGNVRWRQGTHGGGEPVAPVISGDYVIYALTGAGMFVADKHTGEVLQWFDPGDGVSSRPTLTDDDRLFVLSNRGVVYAMDVARF